MEDFDTNSIPLGWRHLGKKVESFVQWRIVDDDEPLISRVAAIEFDLLKKLLEVCAAHNLRVFPFYGTLLGIVRHAKMIPGDDDIDVALPREDYDKLMECADEFSGEYFLQTPWNDNCFFGGFSKLRNKKTTAIAPVNWWVDCCEGIGIDIFPIDDSYESAARERFKNWRIRFYQRLLYAKAYGYYARHLDMRMLEWKAYKYVGKLFSRETLATKLNRIMAEGSRQQDGRCAVYAHYAPHGNAQLLWKAWFEKTIPASYESFLFSVPAGFKQLLAARYGNQFMEFCNSAYRMKLRHGFYSVDAPYSVYKTRFSGLFRPAPENKKIILVGGAVSIAEYHEKFGNKYHPDYIVITDDVGEDVPAHYATVSRLSAADFEKLPPDSVYIVVCSIYIRKTEQFVRQCGFTDYFIFAWPRHWILLANPDDALWDWRMRHGKNPNDDLS